jgi:hypothetical protein
VVAQGVSGRMGPRVELAWNIDLPTTLSVMAPDVPSVGRYLIIQAFLGVAIGLAVGMAMIIADIGGLHGLLRAARPQDTLIFLAGSVMTLCPLVFATAVAILPYARQ